MDKCTVAITVDFLLPIDELSQHLNSYFESVDILALGSEQDVQSIRARFPNAISLMDVNNGYKDHYLLVTSISALLELGDSISRFQSMTLWSDPDIYSKRNEYQSQAEEQSPSHALIRSTLCDVITNTIPTCIVSRTQHGKSDWKKSHNAEVPFSPETIATSFANVEEIEPLIENSGRRRFLIDANTSYTSLPLVEPFLALQEQSKNIEIWCCFDGELPMWMKPDFQIHHIPNDETPLYTNSIDALLLAGEKLDRRKTIDYMGLGLFPIIINKNIAHELSKIIDTSAVAESFPAFGTEGLAVQLANSPEQLDLYNSFSKATVKDNILFNFEEINNNVVNTKECTCFVKSTKFREARNLYLLSNYGDPQGTKFHQSIARASRLVVEINSLPASLVTMTGWTADTEKEKEANLALFDQQHEIPTIVQRRERADVTEALKLAKTAQCGFQLQFPTAPNTSSNDYRIAIKEDKGSLVSLKAFEKSLVENIILSESGHGGLPVQQPLHVKGVLEDKSQKDIVVFELTDFLQPDQEYTLSFKTAKGFISLSNIEVFMASANSFQRMNSELIGHSTDTISMNTTSELQPTVIYLDLSSSQALEKRDVTCQVYSTSPTSIRGSLSRNDEAEEIIA